MRFGLTLQVLGALCLVVAAWLVSPVLGVCVAGVALLLAGFLREMEGGGHGPSSTGPPT